MAAGQLPTPDRVRDLLLSAAATGAALGHMDDLQVLLCCCLVVCVDVCWGGVCALWCVCCQPKCLLQVGQCLLPALSSRTVTTRRPPRPCCLVPACFANQVFPCPVVSALSSNHPVFVLLVPSSPMSSPQAVLLEGRAWQARAAAVLQQPSVVAAAAAAVQADPSASVGSLWSADIAAAAALEMNELEGLIGEGKSEKSWLCHTIL